MDVSTQRRMAADVLNVGKNRVHIDPEGLDAVAAAVTKQDIRNLVKQGVISKKRKNGVSRGRARKKNAQRRKGRGRGHGRRKGKRTARKPAKKQWMQKIRGLRNELKRLRGSETITRSQYRHLYRMAKGNAFRSKKHLHIHLKKTYDIDVEGEQ